MKQTVGIRFSEYGQVQACAYDVPEGDPPLAPADGVMLRTDQGPAFGRVVWQHSRQGRSPSGDAGPADDPAASAPSPDEFPPVFGGPEEEDAEIPGDRDAAAPCRDVDDPSLPDGEKTDPHPDEAARPAALPTVRRATAAELAGAVANERISREAHAFCRHCIAERRLDMKLVDVETLFDRSRMIFYFTAPTRIDFRELVKDLVRQYRTRIELRQIGVRHETQMLGALGNCGMVCCCRRYLRRFAPVTIKMAKEQNLFLNPAKISGICGRLLCCLSYEQENYDAFHRSCPRLGKRYQTSRGIMRVLRGNMFRNSVMVLPDGGQETEYTLEEWQALEPRRADPAPPQQPREGRSSRSSSTGTEPAERQTASAEASSPRPSRRDAARHAARADSDAPPAPEPGDAAPGVEARGKRRRRRRPDPADR